MEGLSQDIQAAIDVVLQGLNFRFKISEVEPDKIKSTMDSKLTSFNIAKELLYKWINSPNAPSETKFNNYVKDLIDAGQGSLKILRRALKADIDYEKLDESRHRLAIESKLAVLNSINELEASVIELRNQYDSGQVLLRPREFKRGFAEKYAAQEFYPAKNYHKNIYNEEEGAIVIDPKGSRGEIIELDGFKIQLPHHPRDKSKIAFSDKAKKDQYWRRTPPPRGITPDNSEVYIDYIMEQFKFRREGYWFMNKGVPTYLTGRHWMQLQWGRMADGGIYPDYRDCQMRLAYHKEACYLDKMSMGQIFLKSRQTGYTYGIISDSMELISSTQNKVNGLTSMTDDDARKAFAKMAYLFQEWPFFFQPIVKGRIDSPNKLDFSKPSDSSKETKKRKETSTDGYVNSSTDFQATKVKAYDGQTMLLYVGDEAAKWDRASYIEHLHTLLPTTFRGGRVTGKVFLGSTMGKLDSGGQDFKTLYLTSKVREKMGSGYTASKLYSYFLPAHKNYESCIDKYGKCWEEAPEEKTLNVFGDPIVKGSIELIRELYSDAKKSGDVAVNAVYRAFPMTESHAMRDESDSCVFNLTKLTDQYDFNDEQDQDKIYSTGNFEWAGGKRFTSVEWVPQERGRFKVWWMPSEADDTMKLRNNVKFERNRYYPMNNYGCIGVDCFGSYTKGKNKASKGASHAVSKNNIQGVPQNKVLYQYIDKPATQDIFNEDILKAAWFYGIPFLPENNRRDFVRYIYLNDCRPFTMNRVDKTTGELDGDDLFLGGQPMQAKDILDSHENAIRTFIQRHIGFGTAEEVIYMKRREGEMAIMPFNETIMDLMKFNPTARTAHDATISIGLALIGNQRDKYKPPLKKADPKNTVSLLRKYSNSGQIGTYIK
tara:strand:+ start:31345 stop:33990 length:2646 start_codon:yes stop_codon:yes gene_type:complete